MKKVFVGRQPIYRDGIDVFAYELLSRDSELNRAAFLDGDRATAQVLLNTFIDIGLDQVVGPNLAFVNVTRNFVLSDYCLSLPKGRVVLELDQDTTCDGPLMEALLRLSRSGYSIALDNFIYRDELRPLLALADIVKVDVQALGSEGVASQVQALREFEVKLLAQKVESHEDYAYCRDLGFDYYQGYFFCKPQILSERAKIPFNRLSTLRLLVKLQHPEISLDELEIAVGQDVAISYRILRYLNSPAHALQRQVESIRHAISLVGTRLISNWASLILLDAIEDKPRELMVTAMVRAHMCQQLGVAMSYRNLDQFFTVGLLSLLDAILDRPMPEALQELPLIDEVKGALLEKSGPLGAALGCIQAYEQADWDNTSCGDLDERSIRDAYLRSVNHTRDYVAEVVGY